MSSSNFKILALVLVIVTPIFFFLVFRPLSKIPRPKAPPRFSEVISVSHHTEEKEVRLLRSLFSWILRREEPKTVEVYDTVFKPIPNFTLQSETGDSLTLDSLRGNIYIADFFFATCPGICPVLTKQLARVQQAFIKDKKVQIVSFTVDPDRDSLPAMREYAKNHGAIAGRWFFLRGSKSEIFTLAKDGFKLTAKDGDDGVPIHSEKLTLIDGNGVIRGWYNGTDSERVDQLMRDVVLLLRETEQVYSFRKNPKKRGGLGKE